MDGVANGDGGDFDDGAAAFVEPGTNEVEDEAPAEPVEPSQPSYKDISDSEIDGASDALFDSLDS